MDAQILAKLSSDFPWVAQFLAMLCIMSTDQCESDHGSKWTKNATFYAPTSEDNIRSGVPYPNADWSTLPKLLQLVSPVVRRQQVNTTYATDTKYNHRHPSCARGGGASSTLMLVDRGVETLVQAEIAQLQGRLNHPVTINVHTNEDLLFAASIATLPVREMEYGLCRIGPVWHEELSDLAQRLVAPILDSVGMKEIALPLSRAVLWNEVVEANTNHVMTLSSHAFNSSSCYLASVIIVDEATWTSMASLFPKSYLRAALQPSLAGVWLQVRVYVEAIRILEALYQQWENPKPGGARTLADLGNPATNVLGLLKSRNVIDQYGDHVLLEGHMTASQAVWELKREWEKEIDRRLRLWLHSPAPLGYSPPDPGAEVKATLGALPITDRSSVAPLSPAQKANVAASGG